MKKLLLTLICVFLITGCQLFDKVKDVTLGEISDWITTNVIDNGLNQVKDYINNNTTIDIDKTIDELESSMKNLKEYNSTIQNLDENKVDIKNAWNNLYGEIQKQYETIKNNKDHPDNIINFDTTLLEKYKKEFEELTKK